MACVTSRDTFLVLAYPLIVAQTISIGRRATFTAPQQISAHGSPSYPSQPRAYRSPGARTVGIPTARNVDIIAHWNRLPSDVRAIRRNQHRTTPDYTLERL
ncbi:hypothetical protein EVAR_92910_1 [Eumeta japonica]|uniref:Uncharacterized protein n=1 Tax=Eumeta variegata TaxID=151549 RepID=A0A4C1TD67_EUMVA|nr:hypothetical protein EVAR_92910_1 [Eumeta japonica]